MVVALTSAQLRAAANIAERIEQLEARLEQLLIGSDQPKAPKKRLTEGSKKRITKSSFLKRPATGHRGALSEAVREVLAASPKPMGVRSIYEALYRQDFAFSFPDPVKNLGVRLYRISGVKPIGKGLFVFEKPYSTSGE